MRRLLLLALALLTIPAAFAGLPDGEKRIVLSSPSENIDIGAVIFSGAGASRTVEVKLNEALFKEHFLSMRPFKCLEGAARFYCHLPYPYEWKGEITETDLTDLEYGLLFVQKAPSEYGINLWNGIYYKLTLGADGKISGALHAVDMDNLASPPAKGDFRPLTPDMLNPAAPEGEWLPFLKIE